MEMIRHFQHCPQKHGEFKKTIYFKGLRTLVSRETCNEYGPYDEQNNIRHDKYPYCQVKMCTQ